MATSHAATPPRLGCAAAAARHWDVFLDEPPPSAARDALYDADRAAGGYVDNLTRLWAWRPDVVDAFAAARSRLQSDWALTDADRAVLVVATARARQDSYCSLAWGTLLADLVGADVAGQLLTGRVKHLEPRLRALASWASAVVAEPNAITAADVDELRAAGLDDRAVFEATTFVAFRLAFATVNDALGAQPDAQLAESAPEPVRDAVGYGRPVAETPSA